MKNRRLDQKHGRCSGILAHITSLPSPFGIGDLGPSSWDFIRFLKNSGQKIWQILPLNPVDPTLGNSPYMSVSAFAGNPLLISPELLVRDGFLQQDSIEQYPLTDIYQVDYTLVLEAKKKLLRLAFANMSKEKLPEFTEFSQSISWLRDYSLFMALKDNFSGLSWNQWPDEISKRKVSELTLFSQRFSDEIDYYCFEQYLFYRQWLELKENAYENNILLFGDIPIYVSFDSADVWANQELFELDDKTGKPETVAGVPPDYFSKTGQKWGNPLYRWNKPDPGLQNKLIDWWTSRFKTVFNLVDIGRIDHFRGFESYYAIPEKYEDGTKGEWMKGPGSTFFSAVFDKTGPLDIVAEDLGEITDEVIKLRDDLGFPGMKILQFAFDGSKDNPFLPFNYTSQNCIVYTGTHDNDTTVGWFLDNSLTDETRDFIKQYCNGSLGDNISINRDLIYLAMSSVASFSIFPLQDILGFGSDCRMNTPGLATGNWQWRCSKEFLTDELSSWLHDITKKFNR